MTDRMIALDSELADNLETLAREQGRSVNEVIGDFLKQHPTPEKPSGKNWAQALVERMEAADIDWVDEPNASENSREKFKQYAYEKWLRTQGSDTDGNS